MRQVFGNGGRRARTVALGMPPTAGAVWVPVSIVADVVDDIVIVTDRVDSGRHIIQVQGMANLPRHNMVSAGGVPTDTKPTDKLSIFIIESQAASENIDSANPASDHGIIGLAKETGWAAISDFCINRIALLEPKKTSPGLHCRIEIGSG